MSRQVPSTFEIFPAIDLRGGRVVRLRQGDFGREQVFSDDPAGVAREFWAAGARWIHVVDLDGARAGERRQLSAVASVAASVPVGMPGVRRRVQVAGGLRSIDVIADLLDTGVDRVVLGTAALRDPALAGSVGAARGVDAIAVALDVRDGMAIGDGWVPGARGTALPAVLDRLDRVGVTTYIVTAIERDGLLGGPDLVLLEQCVRSTPAGVIASGGIRHVADLEAVRRIGCTGAIVGRALYDGSLDLAEAIAWMDRGEAPAAGADAAGPTADAGRPSTNPTG